jgi:hypothetical protein
MQLDFIIIFMTCQSMFSFFVFNTQHVHSYPILVLGRNENFELATREDFFSSFPLTPKGTILP